MLDTSTQRPRGSFASHGIAEYKCGKYKNALTLLEKAASELGSPENLSNRALAAYGASLAYTHKNKTAEAVHFCQTALDRNPVDAELYYALASVYLKANSKRKALRVLERGLKLGTGHAGLELLRDQMGRRSAPPIPFLSRDNFLNKYLGKLRGSLNRG